MPGSAGAYEPVLSGKATTTLLALPRWKQRQVLTLLFRLAERPNQPGDYTTRNEQDRDLQYLRLSNWRISFWADHAVREVRIVGLTKL